MGKKPLIPHYVWQSLQWNRTVPELIEQLNKQGYATTAPTVRRWGKRLGKTVEPTAVEMTNIPTQLKLWLGNTVEPTVAGPLKPGPQTAEARQKASANAKRGWSENRVTYLEKFNAHKPENSVRSLRLQLKNDDGTPMTQNDFAFAIGLSRGNAQRISQFENGLRPTPQLLVKMKRLADAHGIQWEYE